MAHDERARDDAIALGGMPAGQTVSDRASRDDAAPATAEAAPGRHRDEVPESSGEEAPDWRHALAIANPQEREVAERQLWALAYLAERGVPAAWLDAIDERGTHCRRLLTKAGILEETIGLDEATDRAGQDAQASAAVGDRSARHPRPGAPAASQAEAAMVRLSEACAREIRVGVRCRGQEGHAVAAALSVLAHADPERAVGFYEQRARTLELIGQLASLATQEHSTPLVRPQLVPVVCGTLNVAVKVHVAGEASALEPLAGRLSASVNPSSPAAIALRDELAGLFASLGDADRATHVFDEHLSRTTAAYGPDHPATLASRNALAYFRGSVGDLAGAIALYEQVLSGRQRVLGPDDPLTIVSLNNLAYAYGAIGEPGKAVPLCEQVAADTERTSGPSHPDTLLSLNNLAYAYGAIGEPGKAVPLCEQVAADTERTSGPSHPDTLLSLNNLAYAYEAAGHIDRALSVARRAHVDCLATLGPSHRITRNVAHLLDSLSPVDNGQSG